MNDTHTARTLYARHEAHALAVAGRVAREWRVRGDTLDDLFGEVRLALWLCCLRTLDPALPPDAAAHYVALRTKGEMVDYLRSRFVSHLARSSPAALRPVFAHPDAMCDLASGEPPPGEAAERAELRRRDRQTLEWVAASAGLTPRERHIFFQKRLHGRTQESIAADPGVGITPSGVSIVEARVVAKIAVAFPNHRLPARSGFYLRRSLRPQNPRKESPCVAAA